MGKYLSSIVLDHLLVFSCCHLPVFSSRQISELIISASSSLSSRTVGGRLLLAVFATATFQVLGSWGGRSDLSLQCTVTRHGREPSEVTICRLPTLKTLSNVRCKLNSGARLAVYLSALVGRYKGMASWTKESVGNCAT